MKLFTNSERVSIKNLVLQSNEDFFHYKSVDLDQTLIKLALCEKEKYEKINQTAMGIPVVNPLVLIRLPLDESEYLERGQETKEQIVLKNLRELGVDDSRIAFRTGGKEQETGGLWNNGDSVWNELHNGDRPVQNGDRSVWNSDSPVDFFIFDGEPDKSWNLERACALVYFEDVKKLATGMSALPVQPEHFLQALPFDFSNYRFVRQKIMELLDSFFHITADDLVCECEEKLKYYGIVKNPVLKCRIAAKEGFTEHFISGNDVEELCNYYCKALAVGHKNWGMIKAAILTWFRKRVNWSNFEGAKALVTDMKKGEKSAFISCFC